MKASRFYPQAKLMIRCIPAVAQETCFALKGGTAINLFVRAMPRLSVDIDLTYLPTEPRDVALPNISSALGRISERIKKTIPGAKVQETRANGAEARITKLVAALDGQTVTIEPNEVVRGTVFAPEQRSLVKSAENIFEMSARIAVVSLGDLYGGKLCAALDRQHPRDIFDVKLLLENEGITDEIRKAFVIYLASHDRPIHELIEPTRKNIARLYESDLVDMTEQEVSLEELIKTRERYILKLKNELTTSEKRFLITLKEGQPDWSLLGVPNVDKLPAVQWKLLNIQKMKKSKREEYLEKLKTKLGL
jgi:predicted nucleotidyltransferase component of viral defense system